MGYCWIIENNGFKRVSLTYYAPLFFMLPIMAILYIFSAVIMLRRQCQIYKQFGRRKKINISSSVQLYSKLLLFPLVFIITYIVALVRRSIQTIGSEHKHPVSSNFFLFALYLNALVEFSLGFIVTLLLVASDLISFCVDYYRRENTRTDIDIQTEIELEGIDYEKWKNGDTESALDEL